MKKKSSVRYFKENHPPQLKKIKTPAARKKPSAAN